ncbi:MAG: M23 family metallopeptidase [Candidatus Limimorpha sp.]
MKVKLLVILVLTAFYAYSQRAVPYPCYPLPVKYEIDLSATFGELRNNAFHAGVDIKTGGKIGKSVYAVANGYVSRIGVSPFGYGKVVYITHDDGYMSVYAHLDCFNSRIGEYVKNKQLESRSYKQNLMLDKDEIKVCAGDFIGLSGDSGGSGGPHLHYEIRDAKTQHPINPYLFGLRITDNVCPTINGLALYPEPLSSVDGDESARYYRLSENNSLYSVRNGVIKVNGTVFFGISTYDPSEKKNNKYGVNTIELYADNKLIYSILFNEFSYNETRSINSLIDYSKYINEKKRYVRTKIDEYNTLSLYGVKDGSVTLNEGDTVEMRYVVKDFFNNTSTLIFTLVGDKPLDEYNVNQYNSNVYRIAGDSDYTIELDGLSAVFPKKAFFRFEYVDAFIVDTMRNIASDYAYVIGSVDIPLQKSVEVKIRPSKEYASSDKLYAVNISGDGDFSSLGGKMIDSLMSVKCMSLGMFALAVDTIPPTVKTLNFNNNSDITGVKRLKIKIKDVESGISSYDVFVNGQWVVGEYDAKNDLLYYDVDDNIKKGKKNKIDVVVTDNVGNETRQEYSVVSD